MEEYGLYLSGTGKYLWFGCYGHFTELYGRIKGREL
jgi:hypothetical protein